MKNMKIRLLAAVIFAVALSRTEAQMAVIAPSLDFVLNNTYAAQVIYHAQSIGQMVENAANTYNQFQNLLRMEKMALNNLTNVADIRSWDNFMDWYNRQLYLEKQTEERFLNMGVKIGSETYRLSDIEDIPAALASGASNFLDTWTNGLSEQQQREMWLNMGLSPANYAYVQTWKAREQEFARNIMTKRAVINEENMSAMENNNRILARLEEDQSLPDDQRMGEKEMMGYTLQVMIDTNRVMRQMAYDQAEANEHTLAQARLENTPPNPPDLSERWNTSTFGQISDHEGTTEDL